MQGTYRSGEGGRGAFYVPPDLSYDYEGERKRAKTLNKSDGKEKENKNTGSSDRP